MRFNFRNIDGDKFIGLVEQSHDFLNVLKFFNEEKELKEEIENIKKEKIIGEDLIEIFKIGNKYPFWYISEILRQLFKDRFYNKRPTASFIKRFFFVSRCKSKTKDGRECRGYKIIKIKIIFMQIII